MRRSKNIFNAAIVPESLLDEEQAKEFTVGNKEIKTNWLRGLTEDQYITYLASSLHLAQNSKLLEEIKDQVQDTTQITNRQSNIFKIGNLRKKIDHFTLEEREVIEPMAKDFQIRNQPPNCAKMTIQKISGFMNSSYERKCRIENKKLLIDSKKDANVKEISIDLQAYTIELEHLEKPLHHQQFQLFPWLENKLHRLLLYGNGLKYYCLYGEESELKQVQRYFQVENLEIKKLSVFEKLNVQFEQKIITLFGNKVRFYDHNLRNKRAEKVALSIVKQIVEEKIIEQVGKKNQNNNESHIFRSSGNDTSNDKLNNSLIGTEKESNSPLNSQILFETQQIRKKSNSKGKLHETGIFKLRARCGTVYYDELEEPITFQEQNAKPITVQDIQLNLKDQIGMSDVDEESKSFKSSIKGHTKILHYKLSSLLNQNQKFQINIHEVASKTNSKIENSSPRNSDEGSGSASSGRRSTFSHPASKLEISEIKAVEQEEHSPFGSEIQKNLLKKNVDFDMSELRLDKEAFKLDLYDNTQKQALKEKEMNEEKASDKLSKSSSISKRQKYLIRNTFSKKKEDIEVIESSKDGRINLSLSKISMQLPYNTKQLSFEIYQLDPWQQQDRAYVICSREDAVFIDAASPKDINYMTYIPNHDLALNWKISNQSNYFIFVLKGEPKTIYIPFQMDSNPKYQLNCSQLLIADLDKEGYKFAANLTMYCSPEEITIPEKLTTIQFLHKYLANQNYELKQTFIDQSRKEFELKRQWNQLLIKSVLEEEDSYAFDRAVFKGMPDTLYMKLKSKVKDKFNEKQLFDFTENDIRMVEDNIISIAMYDIRVFMKPSNLILKVMNAAYNRYLHQRLKQVYVYFLNKIGSARNLTFVFIKEILNKIESVILLAKKEEEVSAIIDLYFEVEFEIDELFEEISKYFKK